MGKRAWMNSVDVEVDDQGRALFDVAAGAGLTFLAPVPIAQSAAGQTQLVAGQTGQVIRLHALIGMANADGTLQVQSNNSALSGPMQFSFAGGEVIPFNADPRACLLTQPGENLNINTSSIFNGYAVCSTAGA